MLFCFRRTLSVYKKGVSGDHSFTSPGMVMSIASPRMAAPEATSLPLSYTSASRRHPFFHSPSPVRASIRSRLRSMSGVIFMEAIWFSFTGSSHTVCQMPETAVYQMPCGRLACFPTGCGPLLVGSHTRTVSLLLPFCSASVMSKQKGV